MTNEKNAAAARPDFVDYIPPHRKEIYYKIIDNVKALHPICYRLHFLEEHFPPRKLDRALEWLVTNRIVGVLFLKWFEEFCHNSDLEMHAKLLMVVDNAALAPVIAGKNFKT